MKKKYAIVLLCALCAGFLTVGLAAIVPRDGVVNPCAATGGFVTYVCEDAADTCVWSVPDGWKKGPKPSYSGTYKDTITIYFPQDCSSDTLKVVVGGGAEEIFAC